MRRLQLSSGAIQFFTAAPTPPGGFGSAAIPGSHRLMPALGARISNYQLRITLNLCGVISHRHAGVMRTKLRYARSASDRTDSLAGVGNANELAHADRC